MMLFSLRLFSLIAIVFALGACGFGDDEETVEIPNTAPRLVGRVASVHEAEGFVLVQNSGNLKLGAGLLLSTRGEGGRTATLVVSGERMGRFAAADMKSGDVAVGDAVYSRPLLAGAPSTDTEWQKSQTYPQSTPSMGSPSP